MWEYSDRILGAFNDQEGSKDFAGLSGLDTSLGKGLGLKGGHFEQVIVDEDAKINVNMGASNEIAHIRLAKELMAQMLPITYNPLFEQHDSSGNFTDRLTVCSNLIDWADPDQQLFSCDLTSNSSANAVEDDTWYSLLPKPYRRKNAPYDSLEELHMVRGVTDDFWETFVDPDPTHPKKRALTVWGSGTVNVNSANALVLYSVVCSGAPTAQLCTDPLQMPMFMTGVLMAQGITMGAPLFGSAKDFVATMKGQGMLGPLLALTGVKPVTFQSEADFTKSISIESKVFSIYAVGVVKGYKRETRVKIHTVVDFRTTQPLTASAAPSSSSSKPAPGAPGGQSVAVAGQDSSSLAAALQPNVGGQVIYFNIE